MEFLLFLAAVAASTGTAVVSSLVNTYKVKETVRWRQQTKAEKLLEQKELSRWLVREVTRVSKLEQIPKEKIAELLYQLSVLHGSAYLLTFSNYKIKESVDAATTAMQITESIDKKYMFLLSKLVEGVVAAVLRACGEKENIHMATTTAKSLRGLATAFRSYSGGTSQIAEWKNETNKKNPEQ